MSAGQSTLGVKLEYGTATVAAGVITPPTTWTHIPGISDFPALSAAPEAIESTTTDDLTTKTYVPGLIDLGGSLEFTANHTPDLETAVTAAGTAVAEGSIRVFAIEYPAPLAERYWWVGTITPLGPGKVSTNGLMQTSVYISQETAPVKQAVSAG